MIFPSFFPLCNLLPLAKFTIIRKFSQLFRRNRLTSIFTTNYDGNSLPKTVKLHNETIIRLKAVWKINSSKNALIYE